MAEEDVILDPIEEVVQEIEEEEEEFSTLPDEEVSEEE